MRALPFVRVVNLVALLAAFGCRPGLADDSGPPTLFVAPFSGSPKAIEAWQPAMGEGLAEMLVTDLTKLGKFQVLEKSQLEVLKDEIHLGEDGWVEPSEKVEKGGFAAADYMFTAKVTRFGAKESKINVGGVASRIGLGGLGIKQNNVDVRIDWRLVDANNRKVLKAGSAVAEKKGTSFDVGAFTGAGGGTLGVDNKEFMESALGKATVLALSQITEDLKSYNVPPSSRKARKEALTAQAQTAAQAASDTLHRAPGKILAVASKEAIIISLGSRQGFKNGDVVNLFETVDTKDDKGAVVFTEEKLVGELTIQAVQEDKSRASYKGDRDPKAGWVVKAK